MSGPFLLYYSLCIKGAEAGQRVGCDVPFCPLNGHIALDRDQSVFRTQRAPAGAERSRGKQRSAAGA